ncbi:MAG: ABC transporter ATP-binding protein [Synergistaceae bacterium]|jgi:NitT/TauT family transport system ATP-binding protein|nr:ABC transporter ATP-binding protein [Synergistaceae bacterium]
MMELINVSKRFIARREDLLALSGINMRVGDGEFVCVVGPSGCGKSTIIRIINDIIKPSSGRVVVDGFTYEKNAPIPHKLIRRMGFIFQIPNLYPWLTVRENIRLPLDIFGLRGQKWMNHADFLIEKAGLSSCADQYPGSLSQGMSQRAGVVRAMVHKPDILLMDEPFGALDERTRERMDFELLDIWRENGMSVVFITHNIGEAVLLAQRIYIMATAPGRIIDTLRVDLKKRDMSSFEDARFEEYSSRINNAIGNILLEKAV